MDVRRVDAPLRFVRRAADRPRRAPALTLLLIEDHVQRVHHRLQSCNRCGVLCGGISIDLVGDRRRQSRPRAHPQPAVAHLGRGRDAARIGIVGRHGRCGVGRQRDGNERRRGRLADRWRRLRTRRPHGRPFGAQFAGSQDEHQSVAHFPLVSGPGLPFSPRRRPLHRDEQHHGEDVDRRGPQPRAADRKSLYLTIKQWRAPFPAAPSLR